MQAYGFWGKLNSESECVNERYTRIAYSLEQDESCDGILEADVVDGLMRIIKPSASADPSATKRFVCLIYAAMMRGTLTDKKTGLQS